MTISAAITKIFAVFMFWRFCLTCLASQQVTRTYCEPATIAEGTRTPSGSSSTALSGGVAGWNRSSGH